MNDWGWRIPFVIGSLMLPFLLIIRGALKETEQFEKSTHRPDLKASFKAISANFGLVGLGTGMVMMTTVFFYMITAYTPTYGNSVLGFTAVQAMLVPLLVGLTNFILLPIMGALSDRVGRRPQLIAFSALALVTGYAALSWMVAEPSFARLICVELWLAFVYAGYNGAMIVHLTEMMPSSVRTTGFSLAYSLATAIFGGFTPALATWLIDETGNKASPGIWLTVAAGVSLLCALLAGKGMEKTEPDLQAQAA